VFLRFLQGGVGLLSTTQNTLWIPVGQFTTREISIKMFKHLHRYLFTFNAYLLILVIISKSFSEMGETI